MFINIDFNCTAAGSDVLRALYEELSRMLDARVVAANMYQRNALTLKELGPTAHTVSESSSRSR